MNNRRTANSSRAKYVETRVTINHSRPDKGCAFGTALIDGTLTEVFVGSKGNARKEANGRWEKTGTELVPSVDDVLTAKICTEVDPGKKPVAAFWQIIAPLDRGDDRFDRDRDDDDLDDVDETPCDFCGCWPCRCEPEY